MPSAEQTAAGVGVGMSGGPMPTSGAPKARRSPGYRTPLLGFEWPDSTGWEDDLPGELCGVKCWFSENLINGVQLLRRGANDGGANEEGAACMGWDDE